MGSLFLLFVSFLFGDLVSCSLFTEFILPNFTASNLQFADNSGAFLLSRNGTFRASIFSPGDDQVMFYLCVIHSVSGTVIWSANRDAAISNSGNMKLTPQGIKIFGDDGSLKWSTPKLGSLVRGLMLTEMGNLVLVDGFNRSLWESFDHPTDTIVVGQQLREDLMLTSAVSDGDLGTGDYMLVVTDSDAILQWHGQTYWKLSMDTGTYKTSYVDVDFMAVNETGLFLFGRNGTLVVVQVLMSLSDFRIARLDSSGRFIVSGFSGSNEKQEFVGPSDGCQIPLVCGHLGLCTYGGASNSPSCSCAPGFHRDTKKSTPCVPADGSSFPLPCNSSNNNSLSNSSEVLYLRLAYGIGYFATQFYAPVNYGVNLSMCQSFCTADCLCLGIFFDNSSGTCYAIENQLGSVMSTPVVNDELLGYVKALPGNLSSVENSNPSAGQKFPVIALVLLPSAIVLFLFAIGFIWWRKWRSFKQSSTKLRHASSLSSGDLESFCIPGLPQRFDYEELEVATKSFSTLIGSGGFGSVYKGTLPDTTLVAVKRITNLGVQGKKEFYTEIAIIGNIHHVNLVKLRGFCAQGRQRYLVYEYMNHGSLDRTLFGSGPALEWQERFDIALGTARGLAYLHTGCQQKIIHCDVKPENILLHDNFQAKISDFGLSKLLSPEQSSLFTTMRGTRGYLAPEWLTNSAISEKTDVYSFGMVLLELVSGRKNCSMRSQTHSNDENISSAGQSSSSSGSGFVYFPLFALEKHEQRKYLELADPRLEGRVTSEEVEKLVCIALCCVHEEPLLRPSMVNVVGMLEGGIPLGQPRLESLNFLRFYGRRFAEASTIEEENIDSTAMMHPEVNTSATSTSGSHGYLSYISSQQISGPR